MSTFREKFLNLGPLTTFNDRRDEFPPIQLVRQERNGQRFYICPETGKPLVSMSTLSGMMTREAIANWRKRVGEDEANRVSRQAAQRGTKLHSLFEMYVCNQHEQLYAADFTPETLAMFRAAKPTVDSNLSAVLGVECDLYSSRYRIAGRTDLVGIFKGRTCVIDFKNSMKPKKKEWIENYFVQATGYATMWGERYGTMPEGIVILVAVKDGLVQVFEESPLDYMAKLKAVRLQYHNEYERR